MSLIDSNTSFLGYRRENGRGVGQVVDGQDEDVVAHADAAEAVAHA
ncbi:D-galactarate dehydratase, partial [Rubrivivax gelatinosus]|nr:D-galactarate dehydratase [Rubrivivax gelatinosus]